MLEWIAGGALAVAGVVLLLEFGFPALASRLALALERGRAGLRRREIEVDGQRIAYLEGGRGEPLVLVHGFGADGYSWVRIAGHLRRRFRLIAPDLPGFGESGRPADLAYSFQAQTERLHAFVRALGLTRVHIGGNSMGGAITALYGAMYPDAAMSRWVLNAGGVDGSKDSEMAAHYRQTGEALLVVHSPKDLDRVLRFVAHKPPWLPRSVRRTLGARGTADRALHTRIFEELVSSEPINAAMARSEVPTLIVWGDEDRVLDPSGGPILRDATPGAQLIALPGIGHVPMLEAPRRVAKDYLAFVDGLGGH